MSALAWCRLTLALGAFGLLVIFLDMRSHPIDAASPAPQATVPTKATSAPTAVPKPGYTRTPISGGEWKDDFSSYTWQISTTNNINVSSGRISLAFAEKLDWVETWDDHFAHGEFYHTEILSDAVRISRDESTGQYYLFGTYTSAVLDATRSVVWSNASWAHNGPSPCSVIVEFRTGNVSTPDGTWSPWTFSGCSYPPTFCYTYYGTGYYCTSNFSPIPSSRYYQYRATLISSGASGTVALYDMSVTYGIYGLSGSALSYAIAPSDLRSWTQVFFSGTVPAATSYTIDVLSPDGTLLLPNVSSGDSLESIDATRYRMIQLRATLRTDDPSRTPELDQWGLRWWVGWRFFIPSVQR